MCSSDLEAAARFGDDPRTFLIMTQKFVGDEEGNVKELHTVNIEWDKDENGRFTPKPIEGTEKVWPAELVLLAMGFRGPEDTVLEELSVERDARSNAQAEHGKFTTSVEGVLPPAICGAGRASSYGPSTKGAARRARWIGI